MTGLLTLCGKGRRVYYVDMDRSTSIDHSGDPTLNVDRLDRTGLGGPDLSSHAGSPSNESRALAQSTQPTHQILRRLCDLEPRNQIRSRSTATVDPHYRTDDYITTLLLPFASIRPSRHTHLQRVALGVPVYRSAGGSC
jgi:hypothetical protein